MALTEQDTTLRDDALREEAEAILHRAARHRMPGRYQLEAAIQSVHAARAITGEIQWEAIVMLYKEHCEHTFAVGARIGQAIAVSKVNGPATGLALLDALPADAMISHQPYWAARAHLLAELCRGSEAREAYVRAIGLCSDHPIEEFLVGRMKSLS